MNILNVPLELVENKIKEYNGFKDNFDLFFKIGKQYMTKYEVSKVNLHSKEGQEQVRKIVFAMTEEMFEMMNTMKNKSWVKEEYPLDEEHFVEELCDFFAFFIQLLLMLDIDSNKFRDLYIRKEIVNDFRRGSNY